MRISRTMAATALSVAGLLGGAAGAAADDGSTGTPPAPTGTVQQDASGIDAGSPSPGAADGAQSNPLTTINFDEPW